MKNPVENKTPSFLLEKELKSLLELSESSFLSSSSSSYQLRCLGKNNKKKTKCRKRSIKKTLKDTQKKKKRGRPTKFDVLEKFKSPVELRKKHDNNGEYTFTPVMSSQRKVQINATDFTQIGEMLDVTKDVPLKKN